MPDVLFSLQKHPPEKKPGALERRRSCYCCRYSSSSTTASYFPGWYIKTIHLTQTL